MTTYVEWRNANGRANDPSALGDYIKGLISPEGWLSEANASVRTVDYHAREAVVALANARGGEVFVGARNDGTVDGTTVTEQALNETLRQPKAERGEWFETDLLKVSDVAPVPFPEGGRWAYVIQVRVPDRPVFIFENDRYWMAKRSGSDTFRAVDSRESMQWFRESRRGEILRNCYTELSMYLSRLSLHSYLPDGLPERLPYVSKVSEDGSLLRFLTVDDRGRLLGSGIPGVTRSPGFVDLYYAVVGWANTELARRPHAERFQTLRDLGIANAGYGNLDKDILAKLAEFDQYIRDQGFR
jgi:hypothetical protein